MSVVGFFSILGHNCWLSLSEWDQSTQYTSTVWETPGIEHGNVKKRGEKHHTRNTSGYGEKEVSSLTLLDYGLCSFEHVCMR